MLFVCCLLEILGDSSETNLGMSIFLDAEGIHQTTQKGLVFGRRDCDAEFDKQ